MEFVCPNCQQANEISGLSGTGGQYAVDCPYCHHGFTIQIDIQAIPDEEDVVEDVATAAADDQPEAEPKPESNLGLASGSDFGRPTIKLPEEARLAGLDHSDAVQPRSRTPARFFGGLMSLALLALLVLQQAYFRRDELANHDRLRPWLEQLCLYAKCTLAPRRDLKHLRIGRPDVHLNDRFQNVLDASVTIRNEAGFAQALPDLELSFFDLDHHLIAWRRFEPGEYLDTQVSPATIIPANGSLLARVHIVDPGAKAMGFEFKAQ